MNGTPWVKICGFTCGQEAAAAAALGINAVGVVFAASPRRVTPSQAAKVMAHLPSGVNRVGVFANASLEEIKAAIDIAGLDTVQLHGDESPEFIEACAGFSRRIIKGWRVRRNMLHELRAYRDSGIYAYLFDAYVPGTLGGSGCCFDWAIIRDVEIDGRIILAGGLHADNVAAALETASPWGIDVSSGVESAPGRKDIHKIERLLTNIRGYAMKGIDK